MNPLIRIIPKNTVSNPYGFIEYNPFADTAEKVVVISLHGNGNEDGRNNPGETGGESDLNAYLKSKGHLPYMMDNYEVLPECIVICPQTSRGYIEGQNMVDLRNWAAKHYNSENIALMGLSAGGASVWKALVSTPELFFAFVPICGVYNARGPIDRKGASVFAVNGALDTKCWATTTMRNIGYVTGENEGLINEIYVSLGIKPFQIHSINEDIISYFTRGSWVNTDYLVTTGDPTCVIMAGKDHNVWTDTYKFIFPWILAQCETEAEKPKERPLKDVETIDLLLLEETTVLTESEAKAVADELDERVLDAAYRIKKYIL